LETKVIILSISFNPIGKTMIPRIDKSCFIANTAVIIGDVKIAKGCGVYPHAVIRGDQNSIVIGEGSNVQDCCVIHTDIDHNVIIGKNVSVGHLAMVHGAHIEDNCLIGINATVLNGAQIGSGSIIGANALVTTDMIVPKNSLVLGVPGKIVKQDKNFTNIAKENADTYKIITLEHNQGKYLHYKRK
jgi:carbonic anhydrase/acetyltransferase-like protein (isoleucine patch superfamily)